MTVSQQVSFTLLNYSIVFTECVKIQLEAPYAGRPIDTCPYSKKNIFSKEESKKKHVYQNIYF